MVQIIIGKLNANAPTSHLSRTYQSIDDFKSQIALMTPGDIGLLCKNNSFCIYFHSVSNNVIMGSNLLIVKDNITYFNGVSDVVILTSSLKPEGLSACPIAKVLFEFGGIGTGYKLVTFMSTECKGTNVLRTFTKCIDLNKEFTKKEDFEELVSDVEQLTKDVSDCKVLINENASDILDLQDDVSDCKQRVDQLDQNLNDVNEQLNNKIGFAVLNLLKAINNAKSIVSRQGSKN